MAFFGLFLRNAGPHFLLVFFGWFGLANLPIAWENYLVRLRFWPMSWKTGSNLSPDLRVDHEKADVRLQTGLCRFFCFFVSNFPFPELVEILDLKVQR